MNPTPPATPADAKGWESRVLIFLVVSLTAFPSGLCLLLISSPDLGDAGITLLPYQRLVESFTLTCIQVVIACLAVFTALLALEQLRMRMGVTAPAIGLALCWAGVADVCYMLLVDHHFIDQAVLTLPTEINALTKREIAAFGWVVCRTVAVLLLMVGIGLAIREAGKNRARPNLIPITLLGMGAVGAAIWLIAQFGGPTPPHMDLADPLQDPILLRPWDLLPAGLLVIAAFTVCPAYYRLRRSYFAMGLWLSLAPEIAAHCFMAFASQTLFDRPYFAGHALIAVAYTVRFGGLLLDHSRIYVKLQQIHDRLKEEMQALIQSQAERRDLEAMYASLGESLPLGVFQKDREGRFTFANGRFCQSLRLPLDQILGRSDFDFFPKELAEKYREDDRRVLETGEPFEDFEEHQKTPNDRTGSVQVLKSPIRNAEGEIVGVQGMFWEVSDRIKSQRDED